MILYMSIIGISVVILSIVNIVLGSNIWGLNEWWIIAILVGCVIVEFAIDGLMAYLIHELPDKWFEPDKKLYKVSKKERKFYNFLRIKKWKDKVWELGGLGGFRKNKIVDANDYNYLKQFIIESNKGIVIHWAGIVMGCALMLIIPVEYILTVSLPVCVVNAILNIMPIFVLRYNIPKLEVAMQRVKRNEEKLS
jgi:hypothetical protein